MKAIEPDQLQQGAVTIARWQLADPDLDAAVLERLAQLPEAFVGQLCLVDVRLRELMAIQLREAQQCIDQFTHLLRVVTDYFQLAVPLREQLW